MAATFSDAHAGRFLKRALLPNLKSRLNRIILRHTTLPRRPAIKAAHTFYFEPGKPLPVVPSKAGGAIHTSLSLPKLRNAMHRGMLLDVNGTQLRYILRNGLETSKTSAYLRESYDGKKYPLHTKAIFASTWLEEAVCFASPYYQKEPRLAVVFHLKRVGTSSLVQVPHDIPPSWILQVSAWLQIEGKPRWGALKLDKNDNLIFIPYPVE
ncbi:MAG: hypothetical protein II913_01650 [Elusimicrobiaceae bacterium]|nr:hypothetical protein [Elusimicrobiaceae bacterium]